jgi:hypothetical protein
MICVTKFKGIDVTDRTMQISLLSSLKCLNIVTLFEAQKWYFRFCETLFIFVKDYASTVAHTRNCLVALGCCIPTFQYTSLMNSALASLATAGQFDLHSAPRCIFSLFIFLLH